MHCSLEHIANQAFENVPNIFRINLSQNKIAAISNTMFGSIEFLHLVELDLSYNQINSIPPTTFEQLTNLRYLSLSENPLNTINQDTVAALSSISSTLRILDLSYTNIDSLPDGMFNSGSVVLQKLFIQGNRIASIPESLGLLTSLRSLNIGQNLFTELNDESFLGLKNLRSLSINHLNGLKKIKVGTFHPLTSLEVLSCNDNIELKEFNLGELILAKNLKLVRKLL